MVSIPICAEKERNGLPKPFYSQPRQSASCVYANAKPVFETDIVPTDNVRPKLHDKCARHHWLKGYLINIFYTPPACVLLPIISLLSTGHIIRMEQSLGVGVEWNGTR